MKASLILVVLGLVLSSAASARTAPSVRISSTPPAVRVSSAAPLTVIGQSFASQERLRVVVRFDGERKIRLVRAGVTGRFTVRFLEPAVENRCSVGASVTRASGVRVAAKVAPTLCPMPLPPAP